MDPKYSVIKGLHCIHFLWIDINIHHLVFVICILVTALVIIYFSDVNECAIGKHRCYSNQRCINTDPGYRCLCPIGFKSAGPGTPCLGKYTPQNN